MGSRDWPTGFLSFCPQSGRDKSRRLSFGDRPGAREPRRAPELRPAHVRAGLRARAREARAPRAPGAGGGAGGRRERAALRGLRPLGVEPAALHALCDPPGGQALVQAQSLGHRGPWPCPRTRRRRGLAHPRLGGPPPALRKARVPAHQGAAPRSRAQARRSARSPRGLRGGALMPRVAPESRGEWRGVLVVAEHTGKALRPITRELLSKGHDLAERLGTTLSCAVLAQDPG